MPGGAKRPDPHRGPGPPRLLFEMHCQHFSWGKLTCVQLITQRILVSRLRTTQLRATFLTSTHLPGTVIHLAHGIIFILAVSTFFIITDSAYVKFVGHNLKIPHRRHVCICRLRNVTEVYCSPIYICDLTWQLIHCSLTIIIRPKATEHFRHIIILHSTKTIYS